MKTILYTLLTLFISLNSFAQSRYDVNNLTPFVGNWEWVNGNETFKVEVYIEDNYLKGHYFLSDINNGIVTTIYKSNKVINENWGFVFGDAIFGGSQDGILYHASIEDNVLLGEGINDYKATKQGSLGFTIINDGTNGQPITATWEVTILQGLKLDSYPPEFSIPTDIVLTKVN